MPCAASPETVMQGRVEEFHEPATLREWKQRPVTDGAVGIAHREAIGADERGKLTCRGLIPR